MYIKRLHIRSAFLITITSMLLVSLTQAQENLKFYGREQGWEAIVDKSDGTMKSLTFKDGTILNFRTDSLFCGPRWINADISKVDAKNLVFLSEKGAICYSLKYISHHGDFAVVVSMTNKGKDVYSPKYERLNMGINTEMKKFPDWNEVFFPTLLRCEKTHFWGYLMTPKGKIVTVGSAEPIASYVLQYQSGEHRIYSFSLDMLHQQPLPSRHPIQTELKPGECKSWTIVFKQADKLSDVKPTLMTSVNIPMIDAERYSLQENESTTVTIYSKEVIKVRLIAPSGKVDPLNIRTDGANKYLVNLSLSDGAGQYSLQVTDKSGHVSEATFSQLHTYSWYMDKARDAAIKNGQKASSHLEQWLGLTSGVNAARHIPNVSKDAIMDAELMKVLALQWDLEKKEPKNIPHSYRYMSNTAQMAGILAYRYLKEKDIKWLEWASGFADYVLKCQSPEGYYRPNMNLSTIYTSVLYPAKSIMEVIAAEKIAAITDSHWQAAYDRHYLSVKKAMDHLVKVGDNIETEGQLTYEDGMISCSASQLGLFALLQTDPIQRELYSKAAKHFLLGHSCLEQLLVPDSRMNGATLRFWEAQYDVLIRKSMNMMNSPHGWSGWVIPALWYQYLLSGDEIWLTKTMNALGSCIQLIDSKTGMLRWGFVCDPYLAVTMLEEDSTTPGRGKRVEHVICEQYVPMISSFHYPEREPVSGNSELVGWTCDNDVHEIFTAMEEVALTSAYVIERENGKIVSWNCKATINSDGAITILPNDDVVCRVHLNFRNQHQVKIRFLNETVDQIQLPGMSWVGSGGIPELLRK
jgi:hypothetical protein